MVENVGKGENVGYQHFLLVPQCFEKASIPIKTRDCLGKGQSDNLLILILYHTILNINDPETEGFWKHCEKRRKCW